MDKIVIIGSPGAGKSTFAQALGKILNIEVIHLDNYFWRSGWRERPRENRIEIQQYFVRRARWIIEGAYLSSSDSRLDAADTIIFLDAPRSLCLQRVIIRHIRYKGRARPDLAGGCTDKLGLLSILKVLVFPYRGRKLLLSKMETIRKKETDKMYRKKTILILSSREDVLAFLRVLKERLAQDQRTLDDLQAFSRESSGFNLDRNQINHYASNLLRRSNMIWLILASLLGRFMPFCRDRPL